MRYGVTRPMARAARSGRPQVQWYYIHLYAQSKPYVLCGNVTAYRYGSVAYCVLCSLRFEVPTRSSGLENTM